MPLDDIETIVVVMLENRSFDHMLGYLSLSNQAGQMKPMKVEGLSSDSQWLANTANRYNQSSYQAFLLKPAQQVFDDPPHESDSIAHQISTPPADKSLGGMGGFVESYMMRRPRPLDSDCGLVMGYYDANAVPVFDFLARNYAVCDHWFSPLPTGTQPNRLMAMSGESRIKDNSAVLLPEQPLVYDWLTEQQVSWCVYHDGSFLPFFSLMPKWLPEIITSLTHSFFNAGAGRFRRYKHFQTDWQTNQPMPNVIFIEPEYTDGPRAWPNDDHPPTGVALGQLFVADIYNTLVSNPKRWAKTMMIITYDEHGGFFDHVSPLNISQNVAGFVFKTTGVRVPALIVSPQVEVGKVFKGKLDHTSILQLLADRFHANQDYSASVGRRAAQLDNLSDVLSGIQLPLRATPVPDTVIGQLKQLTQTLSSTASIDTDPGAYATANAQALTIAAQKAAIDHPDLIRTDAWRNLHPFLK